MTRETKIGLVVAMSFLLLVGVVVTARLWQGNVPPRRYNADSVILKTQGAKPENKSPAAALSPAHPPAASVKPGIQQAGGLENFTPVSEDEQQRMLRSLSEAVMNPTENIPTPANPFNNLTLPDQVAFDDTPPLPPMPKETAKPKEQPPAVPPKPQAPVEEPGLPPVTPPPSGGLDLPPAPGEPTAKPPAAPVELPPTTPAPVPAPPIPMPQPESGKPAVTPFSAPPPTPEPTPVNPPAGPVGLPPAPTFTPAPTPPPLPLGNPPENVGSLPTTPKEAPPGFPTPPPPAGTDFPLPKITEAAPMPTPPPPPPPSGFKPSVQTPIPLPMNPDAPITIAPTPPVIPMPETLPTVRPMPEQNPNVAIKPLPPSLPPDNVPPPNFVGQNPPPMKPINVTIPPPPTYPVNNGSSNLPPMPPITAQPPIGSPPSINAPPIRIPVAPQVRSYDVQDYRVQPGDGSFADISQKIYKSSGYGRALLTFNREYPLASETFRQEPPQLQPGQVVIIPPLEVLTSKYGTMIGDPGPQASVNVTPPATNIGVNTEAPPFRASVPQPTPNTQAPTQLAGKQWTAEDGTRLYRVGGNGESLLEIARNILGDGRRWAEIYRLNPELRPEFPIPAGKDIKIPVGTP